MWLDQQGSILTLFEAHKTIHAQHWNHGSTCMYMYASAIFLPLAPLGGKAIAVLVVLLVHVLH